MFLIYYVIDILMRSIIVSTLFTSVLYIIVYVLFRKKTFPFNKVLFFGFLFYLSMLLSVTVFRRGLFMNTTHDINIIPFDELLTSSYYQMNIWGKRSAFLIFSYNVFGNILWFVPFGLLSSYIFKNMNGIKVFLLSFLLSFSIEGMQYVFYTGISDVDDIIFNVLGGLIGYGIYKWINKRKE